jgi:hypothetical protein
MFWLPLAVGSTILKGIQEYNNAEDAKKNAKKAFKPVEYNSGQARENLRTQTATAVNSGIQAAGRQASAQGTSGTGQTLATERAISNVGAGQIMQGNQEIDQRQFAVDQANQQMDIQRQAYLDANRFNPADLIPAAVNIGASIYQLENPEKFMPKYPAPVQQGNGYSTSPQQSAFYNPPAIGIQPQMPPNQLGMQGLYQQQPNPYQYPQWRRGSY